MQLLLDHPMVPSLRRDTHKTLYGLCPSKYAAPKLLESSSSWHALGGNPPLLATLNSYRNLLYQIDLGKLEAIIFLNHRPTQQI